MLLFFLESGYTSPIYKMLSQLRNYRTHGRDYTYNFDGDDQLGELNTSIKELTEENKHVPYWHHCGIYGYRRQALERFVSLPASPLEKLEKLEQLRALEDGMIIKCVEIKPGGPAIDTEADLQAAEAYLKAHLK